MLLFHGTRGQRSVIESIGREGLRARRHEWTHDRVGHAASTFLANAPVSGRGGDPVAFAMGWNGGRAHAHDGWIVVVDLPHARRDLIHAVVPNLELEQYFAATDLRHALLGSAAVFDWPSRRVTYHRRSPLVVEVLEELGRLPELARVARALSPVLSWRRDDLRSDDFSFAKWSRYAGDLRAATTLDEVARAGRRWGFTWENPEVPHCALCVQGMATWVYPLEVPLACAADEHVGLFASVGGRDLFGDGLASIARTVARGYASAPPGRVAEAFAKVAGEGRSLRDWGELVARTPIDLAALPTSWSPDFGRHWKDEDLRRPDVQVVCDAIEPEYVLGAMRVAAGARLQGWARPRRGETLVAKLWHAATVIRHRHRGRMVLYDG